MASTSSVNIVSHFSDYYHSLDEASKSRYGEKIAKLGGLKDPYLIARDTVGDSWENWPNVEYPDLFSYLIHTTSEYTGESLKAYKSLASYKYVASGWVADVQAFPVPGSDVHLVVASVRHSQKLSVPPVRSWVVAKKEGTVVMGHCTCMAGLGEACSHIGAVLFTLEANTRYKQSISCTSLPCSWLPPTFQSVEYAPIANIDFMTADEKPKRKKSKTATTSTPNCQEDLTSRTPSPEELDAFFNDLSKSGSKAVILSLTPKYCADYKPLSTALPSPLDHLFARSNMDLSYIDLLCKCDSIYDEYKITTDQSKNVELYTREQSLSKMWFQQRAGRVTASRLRAAVCTDTTQPSKSLIRTICYPEVMKFSSKATCWGCEHEQIAYDAYKSQFSSLHSNFHLSKSGLVIHVDHPFMGASPDGLISCSCCGNGVLEIKCPYSCKDKSFVTKSNESSFFLTNENGTLLLNVYHAYYFQVQAQMKFCSLSYSDFVVWREEELFVQRIYLDEPFITIALEKASTFIKVGILPELTAKWYTREPSTFSTNIITFMHEESESELKEEWCYCRKGSSGQMICCDSKDCPIQWYHTTCLKIKKAPKGFVQAAM